MKKAIWILIAVVVIGGIVWGQSRKQNSNTSVIKVGAPLSLTGSASVDALNIRRGMELAREDLEEKGINVEIIYEDDGTDPKRTVGSVKKLIDINKVDFVIGPTWSFLGTAASPIFTQTQMVSYAPANTSEYVEGGQYNFFGATKNIEKREPIAEWLKNNNSKKVAIIIDNAAWGLSNLEAFQLAVEDAGAEIVFTERIPPGQEASFMPTAMTKIIALKADALLTTGFDQGMTILVKKSQELGLDIPILIATELVEGLIKNGVVSVGSTDKLYQTSSIIDSGFSKKFLEKYGEEPGNYADRAYDGLILLAQAMTEKDENETLESYLRNKTKYTGYGAVYDFDEKGDIVGGKWVITRIGNK